MSEETYAIPNDFMWGRSIKIDREKCIKCKKCIEACRRDVLIPDDQDGGIPIVLYPDECWYCGCCVQECERNAISFNYPLPQRIVVIWKERGSEDFSYLKPKEKT